MANVAENNIYTDADGKIVKETHPSVAWLAVPAGDEIPDEIQKQLDKPKRGRKPKSETVPPAAEPIEE